MSMLAPLVVETIGTVGSEMGGMVSSMSAAQYTAIMANAARGMNPSINS